MNIKNISMSISLLSIVILYSIALLASLDVVEVSGSSWKIFLGVLGIFSSVITVFMLWHLWKNPNTNNKLPWLLLVAFTGHLFCIFYWYKVYRKK